MTEAVIVALITSGVTLFGVILANSRQNAVVQNELKHLTEELREHNNFARRMPVVEEKLSVLDHRVRELEREGKYDA